MAAREGIAHQLVDVVAGIAVVTGIMMLVRSGSQGPALVDAVGSAFITATQATIGYGDGSTARGVPRQRKKSSGSGSSDGGPFVAPDGGLPIPGLPILPGLPTIPNPLKSLMDLF